MQSKVNQKFFFKKKESYSEYIKAASLEVHPGMGIPFRFSSNPNLFQISMELSKDSKHAGKCLNLLRPGAKKGHTCVSCYFVTQLFCVILTLHHMENFFTTIFNFNEYLFVYVVNIRLICDDRIYFCT